ncbi:RNA polymerase sigma factor [Chitinophaga rhizophila]|uniref:Sigma-70 family RNA polymerase sigma factor n=1 Tax=Chitinophaga rhizophila TaxID=2866212 RepID=A0ABS7GHS0_9BACT|nr:sigma-70 family RNA polymerase sigma factor [Chitinophaga rhizophila]MBW8687244.1 sigma-70 family RNA polymerase sigma factor [Chitinophaga rhizophila]
MNRYHDLSDTQLSGMLNNRDTAAYTEIYNRHWEIIYNYARRWKLDHDQAKDIVQDTFLRFYNKIGETDFSNAPLAAYLYKIARNLILQAEEKEEVRQRHSASLARYVNTVSRQADDNLLEKDMIRQIEEEIARLPKKTRLVFEKSRKEYLSHKAIADELNMNEPAVRKHISNALQAIKAKLGMRFFLTVMNIILWLHK